MNVLQSASNRVRQLSKTHSNKDLDLLIHSILLFSCVLAFLASIPFPPLQIHSTNYFAFTCAQSFVVYTGLVYLSMGKTQSPRLQKAIVLITCAMCLFELVYNSHIGRFNMALGQTSLLYMLGVMYFSPRMTARQEVILKLSGMTMAMFALSLWFNTREHDLKIFNFHEYSFLEVSLFYVLSVLTLKKSKAVSKTVLDSKPKSFAIVKLLFVLIPLSTLAFSAIIQTVLDTRYPVMIPVVLALGASLFNTLVIVLKFKSLNKLRRDEARKAQQLSRQRDRLKTYLAALRHERNEVRELNQLLSAELDSSNLNLREAVKQAASERRKAIEALHAKMRLLSILSHDLKGPIGVISTLSNELIDLDSMDKGHAKSLRSVSSHLDSLLSDLIELGRVNRDAMQIQKTPTCLSDFFGDLAAFCKPITDAKGLEFVYESNLNGDEHVAVDQVRLKQALFNLMNNSVKFTSEGHLALRVQATALGQDRLFLRIKVSDTGPGISQAYLSTIFELFNQGAEHVSQTYGGSGIGLFVVKDLVSRMGGEIEVDSTVGVGTCFTVELTLEKPRQADIQERTGPEQESLQLSIDFGTPCVSQIWTGKRVLIIDDYDMGREICRLMVEKTGCEATEASTGQMGLEYLKRERFDLVLLDIQLPDTSGLSLAQRIREELGSQCPLIVGLSGEDPRTATAKSQEAGMNLYLEKPLKREDIHQISGLFHIIPARSA